MPGFHFAIVGARGTTGQELQSLLADHPVTTQVTCVTARDPELTPKDADGLDGLQPFNPAALSQTDGVFLCTPHGASAGLADALLAHGARVVDLSGDLRLRDPNQHVQVYGGVAFPELRAHAVYGLHEWHRDELTPSTRLVSNPGCYPTAVAMALRPLVETGLITTDAAVVADCKSGASGAGAKPSATTHFGNVTENLSAYGIGTHRHSPEIQQETGLTVTFVPHLLPVWRGLLATIYLPKTKTLTARAVGDALRTRYDAEAFVHVTKNQEYPSLRDVQHTNDCVLGVADADSHVVVVAAIDNLIKGAAGQAIQNMNSLCGIQDCIGLPSRTVTGARSTNRSTAFAVHS